MDRLILEEWRPVPGELGYEVSDQGRIRSLDRVVQTRSGLRRYRGRILVLSPKDDGYLVVKLGCYKPVRLVHYLVLETFVGPRPVGMEACHRDDVRTNNRLVNLRWDTPKENGQDRVRNGRLRCKVTPDEVREIRLRVEAGEMQTAIAREKGMTKGAINRLVLRRCWAAVA